MAKKKKRSTKVDKNYSVVIIALTVVLAALIVVAMTLTGPGSGGGTKDPVHTTAGTQGTEGVPGGNGSGTAGESDPTPSGEAAPTPSGETPQSTAPVQTQPVIVKPTEPAVLPTIGEGESSYEHWLAAGMVMAVSMEYPDFELLGIYAASETPVAYHSTSAGAYVHFLSGGEELLIHSVPLEGERSASGTMDLYTSQLGFATFDREAVGSVDLGGLEKLSLEDLGELINQSLLVSLYGR